MSNIKTVQELTFVRLLLWRLGIVYACFTIIRLAFLIYNYDAFAGISWSETAYLGLVALRFDTSSIFYINSLLIVLHLLPTSLRYKQWWQRLQQSIFIFINVPILFIEVGDVAYFPFAFRRVLRSDFEMQDDFTNLLPQFVADYWYLLLFFIALSWLLNYFYKRTSAVLTQIPLNIGIQSVLFILGMGIMVIGMRGGLQHRPIMSSTAANYVSNTKWMPLVSNATLNLIHSFQQRTIDIPKYFSKEEIKQFVQLQKSPSEQQFTNKNVIIIVIESMGHEYLGYFHPNQPSHTPFLDSLMREGYFFEHCMANGTRSTQGIASITGGLPSLMNDPYIFSPYQGNQVIGIGNLLQKKGYTTAFFHGGEVGTMDFNKFAPLAGFKYYHGRSHYEEKHPDKLHNYDGNWGIWDIPFYDYMIAEIDTYKEPFYTTLLTINPHHPFHVPNDFYSTQGTEAGLWLSIEYADAAFKHFWTKVKNKDWFNNTLFVLTADHNGPIQEQHYNNRHARYRVPLWFYHPLDSNLHHKEDKQISQQIDILPTIMDYLGYDKNYPAFGNNLLATSRPSYHYTFENDIYQIIDNRFVLQFDGEKSIALFDHIVDGGLTSNLLGQHEKDEIRLEQQLKAMIQTHHEVMVKNKFYEYYENE